MNQHIKNGIIQFPATLKATMNVMCFPFAGGGTVNYSRWRADLDPEIDLFALNLPGRERFFGQPCVTDFKKVIGSLAEFWASKEDIPLVFFGHSFGGLTAYFTALELNKIGHKGPIHVFISARVPPFKSTVTLSSLSQEQFKIAIVEKYQGIPEQILNNVDLLNLFLPIIHHDFKMYEQYPDLLASYKNQHLDCDITTIGFTEDNIEERVFHEWQSLTTGNYSHLQMDGGHFEILTRWNELVALINKLKS